MRFSVAIPAGLFLALCVPLAACDRPARHGDAAAPADTEAVAAAVDRTEAEMLAAFKAKDAASLAGYYSDDAVVATPGRLATGREAIRKAIGEDLGDPAFTLDFTREKTDVAGSGDLAYTRGTFRVTYTNPKTKKAENAAGNYVTVFRKQADGSWKTVADIATPGAPPEA